jgi:hypothetical protein
MATVLARPSGHVNGFGNLSKPAILFMEPFAWSAGSLYEQVQNNGDTARYPGRFARDDDRNFLSS